MYLSGTGVGPHRLASSWLARKYHSNVAPHLLFPSFLFPFPLLRLEGLIHVHFNHHLSHECWFLVCFLHFYFPWNPLFTHRSVIQSYFLFLSP